MDLGTTNSAVAYVDTAEAPWQVRDLPIAQVVAPGQVEPRETLPSFHYQPPAAESMAGGLRLPWSGRPPTFAIGLYAREQGVLSPGRLISSAKSWLCHAGVDRRGAILPWHAADDVERLSPVEASASYLRHVRDAWNSRFPHESLESQDFVLTLPASFDEVARELTIEAAALAGLPRVVLIEEPQAAFYAWLARHSGDWERQVAPGETILVCDIGGGTSDFTLIRVRRGEGGKAQFHRVAVGDHLILGGDNLDLALAHHLEQRLKSANESLSLAPRQWDYLVRACRRVKEELLVDGGPSEFTINLPGSGTRLIGGGLQVPVTRDEVSTVLLEGFFPRVPLGATPIARRSGFQEFGLPFASDPAITRHLAAFLVAHRHAGRDPEGARELAGTDAIDPARPDIVLFNGGLFESPAIQRRVIETLESWFRTSATPGWTPRQLAHQRLDLAVARGAAYYGMVRRGEGVRIAATLARSYYVGVMDGECAKAVCLLPGSAEPGQEFHLQNRRFELLVAQPAEFPLYVSSTRLADRPGEVLEVDPEQMRALPPIRTALKTRRRGDSDTATVELHAKLTEIGTVDLWCAESQGPRSWRLQFDVRSATQTDREAHESAAETQGVVDEGVWNQCRQVLDEVFPLAESSSTTDGLAPDRLMKGLAEAIGAPRHDWPTSLLRRIAERLLEADSGRRRSSTHETRWLNLLGYSLRPGYGLAVDDWRVSETWKLVQGKLAFGAAANRTESLILWRRIAGGLTAGQQRAVAEPLLVPIRALHRRLMTGKDRPGEPTFSPHEAPEVWRLVGSLELLPATLKAELGRIALDLLPKRKLEPLRGVLVWTIGRIGSREPIYGPLNTVVASEAAKLWLGRLLEFSEAVEGELLGAVMLAVTLLARRTGDRYRDLPVVERERALAWLAERNAPSHYRELVDAGGRLDAEAEGRVFGESLPAGLRLV
jgi:molecular chaperone DnaK (HSP70)